MEVCQNLTTASSMTQRVSTRSSIAGPQIVVTARIALAVHLDATGTAWHVSATSTPCARRRRMNDLLYVALIVGFFALALLILKAVDRL